MTADRESGLTTTSGLTGFNNVQPGDGFLTITSPTTGLHAVIDAGDILDIEEMLQGIRLTVKTASGSEAFEVDGDPRVLRANLNTALVLANARRGRREPTQLGFAERVLEVTYAEDDDA